MKHQGPIRLSGVRALVSRHHGCSHIAQRAFISGDLDGGARESGGRGTDHALCSKAISRKQVGESEEVWIKKKKEWQMVDVAEESGAWGCHSPLPEIVRSCVRKLSWMCDSDRVVWANRWYLGPLTTQERHTHTSILRTSMQFYNQV